MVDSFCFMASACVSLLAVIVKVFTRHSTACPKADQRYWSRCRCPKAIWITDQNGSRRVSAKTRSWQKAEEKARRLLAGESAPTERTTIAFALDQHLADKRSQNLTDSTIYKTKLMYAQIKEWALLHGVVYLDEIRLAHLEKLRASWKDGPTARKKKQERLRGFFWYCVRHKWIAENPALGLSRVKASESPTLPFSKEEMALMLAKIDSMYVDPRGTNGNPERLRNRMRALLLLMRWSGLRIGDAVTLEKSRVQDSKLFLYMAKTGAPVFVPLPPQVIEALSLTDNSNPQYFFWTGNGLVKSAVADWQRALRRLFKACEFKHRAHPHMLRDTFAVELLLAGVSLDQVSILLGHKSVKITEKHYAPFVRARQDQLEASVRQSW